MLRFSPLFAIVVLSSSANAQLASTTCQSSSDLIQRVRDGFIAKPYEKPRFSFRRYQVWGGGRNFVTIVDTNGDFENGRWYSDQEVTNRLTDVLNQYYQTQPDTAQFIALFSSFQVPFPGAFYMPLANDVSGIGYRHSLFGSVETFDGTEDSPLEGLIVMNDYTLWGGIDDLSVVFNQELGHRWGAFVHFAEEGARVTSDLLLGRDLAHWSFWFNSGGSPMEGNLWRENTDGTFTTVTQNSSFAYHPLDLYLMGLIGPEDVPPFWFVENPQTGSGRINRETGPAYFRSVTAQGTKKQLTIDNIIRAEGARSPSVAESPKSFNIGFIFVVRKGQQTDATLMNEFADVVDALVTKWQGATGNRASLEVVSQGPTPPPQKALGESCEGMFQCDAVQSTACIAPKLNSGLGSFCARRCSATSPCPTGFCCSPANLIGDPRYCFNTALANVCPAEEPVDAGTPVADAGLPGADGGVSADGGASPAPSGGCGVTEGGSGPGLLVMLFSLVIATIFLRRRSH